MYKNKDNTHLLDLYNKWQNQPQVYGNQMAEVVDKIMFSTLANRKTLPFYHRYEDREDLLQDIRLMCFKQLSRIKNPSNKRIFNYLRVSIRLFLKDRTRRVGRKLDQEKKENQLKDDITINPNILPDFSNNLTNQIATLLSEGYTKVAICDSLQISYPKLQKHIEEMREQLQNDQY